MLHLWKWLLWCMLHRGSFEKFEYRQKYEFSRKKLFPRKDQGTGAIDWRNKKSQKISCQCPFKAGKFLVKNVYKLRKLVMKSNNTPWLPVLMNLVLWHLFPLLLQYSWMNNVMAFSYALCLCDTVCTGTRIKTQVIKEANICNYRNVLFMDF